jgi:hypothetical protein
MPLSEISREIPFPDANQYIRTPYGQVRLRWALSVRGGLQQENAYEYEYALPGVIEKLRDLVSW